MVEFSNISDMNMAVLTLYRINESLYNCNVHQRSRDYKAWFYEIMVLLGEASASMKGTETNILKSSDELIELLAQNKKTRDDFAQAKILISEIEPLVNGSTAKTLNYQDLFMKLFYLGIFIKIILKKGGVLMRLREDANFGI